VHRVLAAALGAIVLVANAPTVPAEHAVYYRYVVLGFLKDPGGKLMRGHPVDVVRDKTGFAYHGETDDQGFYVVVVRLGDESVGETLTVRVGGASTSLTARFDPANHTDDRGTRLDLEGARFVERTGAFRPTLARFLRTDTH
jgi:hypothetical protein